MRLTQSDRGFHFVMHPLYSGERQGEEERLVSESSCVGDGKGKPGSRCLWVGDNHHLSRDEVRQLERYIHRWLTTGTLAPRKRKGEPHAEE